MHYEDPISMFPLTKVLSCFVSKCHMRWLEQLCIQYLEATISVSNVLEALKNAVHLNLYCPKEYCLKFIVKESNYTQIVMSKEFESLDQPVMVEIVRRRQAPRTHSSLESSCVAEGSL